MVKRNAERIGWRAVAIEPIRRPTRIWTRKLGCRPKVAAVANMMVKFGIVSVTERFSLTFRSRSSEWAIATAAVLWGVLAFDSPGLFQRPYFQPIAQHITQRHCSIGAIAIGLIHILALAVNGTFRPTARIRASCCSISAMFWSFMLIGAASLDWRTPGAAYPTVLIALSLFSAWWAASDYYMEAYDGRLGNGDRVNSPAPSGSPKGVGQ